MSERHAKPTEKTPLASATPAHLSDPASTGREMQDDQTVIVAPGSAQVSSLTGAPPLISDKVTWRLVNDADGTVAIAESSAGIIEVDDGVDPPLVRYDRPYTAPLTAGRYLVIWRYGLQEVSQNVVVAGLSVAAFATTSDVAARLGRALSSREQSDVPFLLNMAAAVIADAAGYDDGWAVTLSPVPTMLRLLSVELVCRALPNPSQYSAFQQQVGSYSFRGEQPIPGMKLSDQEESMVRRAVHGRTTDSAHVISSLQAEQDEYWLRQQAPRPDDADVLPGDVIA